MRFRRALLAFTGIGALVALALPPGTAAAVQASGGPGWQAVGARPPIPTNAVDEGTVGDSTPLQLDVLLNPRDPAGMAAMASAVSDPSSPEFRQYLAPGQFAQEFGPTPATIASEVAALKGQGLDPGPVSGNGLDIPITTTANTAEHAFRVQLHQFKLANGRQAYANTAAPTVPEDASNVVEGVAGLDDLNPPQPADGTDRTPGAPAGNGSTATTGTLTDSCGNGNYDATPGDLAAAYGFSGLYNEGDLGSGATIGLFELSGYSSSDISTYQACYGSTATVTDVPAAGIAVNSGVDEVTGDIEFVSSLAPKANILVYESNSYIGNWSTIVSDDAAPVVSTSWSGGCEPQSTVQAAENTDLMEAAMQGQTVFAASGDGGSEDCTQGAKTPQTELAVQDPASQPYITGVGGTNISAYGPPPTETAWNASTGGISQDWPMPSWQAGPGVINSYSSGTPCGAASGYCREVPDVSALAGSPGYPYYCTAGTAMGECNNEGWQNFYGTSGAAPLWGAFAALTDSSCSSGQRLGFINPLLYELASVSKGSGAGYFNDITVGNNDLLNANGGDYPATPGYDLATGLGSPIGVPLAGALCHAATVDVTVTGSATYGGGVTFASHTASLPAGVTVAGNLTACKTSIGSSSPAGTYDGTITGCQGLVLSGPNAANYTIFYDDGGVTVAPAPLTITASGGTMTYGGAPPTITASYSGFVNGDGPGVLSPGPTCSANATATTPAGVYPNQTSCSGASDPNYTITYLNGTLTVNQAPLTITASAGTMTYGGTPPTITPSYSGFVNGESAVDLTPPPTCTANASGVMAAGVYPNQTSCSDASDPNYTITYVTGTLTVNQAPLTITASPGTMVYGGTPPTITPSYSGFVNGEGPAVLSPGPTCTANASGTTPAGVYPNQTSCSGASDPNYAITYVNGTLTVTKAPTAISLAPPVSVLGSLLSLKITFTGTLTSQVTKAGIPNEPVTFTISSEPKATCTATTNAQGVASCSVTILALPVFALVPPYTATFPGDANYLGSGATANPTLF